MHNPKQTVAAQTVLKGQQGSVQDVLGRMPVNVESGSLLEIGGVAATVCFSSQVGAPWWQDTKGRACLLAALMPAAPLLAAQHCGLLFHPSEWHKAFLQAAKLQRHPAQQL